MRNRKGPDPLLQSVFQQTDVRNPAVAYVGVASGDNAEFRLWMAGLMQKSGAGQVTLAPLCGSRGDPDKARAVLEASDLVFVSGGDVEEGMGVLREKEMISVLRRLHQGGKLFFGTSAGSIMLARQWIRWPDPDDEASAALFDCLGLAPVFCDTHGEDDGWEELQALLHLSPVGTIGHGIVSGAGLIVKPDGTVSAIGGEAHRFQNKGSGVVQIESLWPDKTAD
jgi:cyanophycinase-like exopeptidase